MPRKYRADHVGSLLRPQGVLDAHAAQREGRMTEQQVKEIEDRAILDAIAMQKSVGIEVLSDGEIRRSGWSGDFQYAVSGFVAGAPALRLQWHNPETGEPIQMTPPAAPNTNPAGGQLIGNKLKQERPLTEHEAPFLKANAGGIPYKVTIPAASYITTRGFKPGVTDNAYPNRKAVLDDVTSIIAGEVRRLAAEGVPYIQVDNPHYPDYIDAGRVDQMKAMGLNIAETIQNDVDADNASIEGVDRDKTLVAMHFCRGNGGRGGWHTAGGYDAIAEQVFTQLKYDALLLEYDSDRAGGFEPLRFVPKGVVVVLGLITTKSGELEKADDIVRRIEEASKFVDIDDLALSPQCGFASVAMGNPVTPEEQRQKLALVVEVARRVWK
ncbi:MAG TPA: 5-methyltetrahydropteroyltriglutamate--homocysteine S-methyltransferase [Dehalococcoidia bacterium]|nr:5-methyltetrahydropteroyltriglutamate--homocysteine S-methyltransferase [Dehalococcoidia bacterium]